MEKLKCHIWDTTPAVGMTIKDMIDKINEMIEEINNLKSDKMKTKNEDKSVEYIPFGEEWENELMKMPKISIITLYRSLCLKEQESHQEWRVSDADIEKAFPVNDQNNLMRRNNGLRQEGAKWMRSQFEQSEQKATPEAGDKLTPGLSDEDIMAWAKSVQPERGGFINDYVYSARAMRDGKIKPTNSKENK